MKKIKTFGYDPLYEYSIDELKQMHKKQEELTDKEALRRAKKTYRTIDRLNKKELRSWQNIRENEIKLENIEER